MKQSIFLLSLVFISVALKAQTYEGKGSKNGDSYGTGSPYGYGDEPLAKPNERFNSFKIFKEKEKYGIKKRDTLILPAIYDEISSLGYGYLLKQNNLFGVANSNGKAIIPVKYEKISYNYSSDQAYYVLKNTKYGAFDLQGNVILPVNYNKILFSSAQSGASIVEDESGNVQLIFKNLEICKEKLENIEIYNDGIIGSLNGKFGILKDGKVLIPFEYENIADQNKSHIRKIKSTDGSKEFSLNIHQNNFFLITKNQKIGLLNSKGQFVLNPEYDKIQYDNLRHIYHLTKDKLSGIYFEGSKKILNCEYQSVYTDGATFITIQKDKKYGIIDYQVNTIIPIEFDEIRIKGWNDFFSVKKDGKYGYYSKKGEVIIPIRYDNLDGFYESKLNHLLKATIGDSVGVINLKNEVVVPIKFKFAYSIEDFIQVELKGKRGLYSITGKEILKPEYDRIYRSETQKSNLVFQVKDNLIGIIGKAGEILYDAQFKTINYIHDEDLLINPFSGNGKIYRYVKHKNGKFGVFEEFNSKMVIPIEYDTVCRRFDFGNATYFILKKGSMYGVVNQKNEVIIGFHYQLLSFDKLSNYYREQDLEEPIEAQNIFVVAKKGSKFGVIDFKEKIWVPFQYSSIERVSYQPLFKASKGKIYQLIDQNNTVLNAGPFDEIAYFEDFKTLTFYKGDMRVIDTKGKFLTSAVKMEPHNGYKSFEELKQALIYAFEDPKDQSLLEFAKKISPSKHILYYLKENVFNQESLEYTNPEEVSEIYYSRLLVFKQRYWNSELYDKRSLTEIQDYTMYRKNLVTNERTEDHAFGDTRFMEKVLRNSIKINGYWISTYFMYRGFNRY